MSVIIPAETIVRNGIRERLKDFIPRINAKIELAEKSGEHFIELNEKIPSDVKAAYEQAGYSVEDSYSYNSPRISWQDKYDEIVENSEEMEALIGEVSDCGSNDNSDFFEKF